jgi:hypothetical protein
VLRKLKVRSEVESRRNGETERMGREICKDYALLEVCLLRKLKVRSEVESRRNGETEHKGMNRREGEKR